jgi:hypothetical protein
MDALAITAKSYQIFHKGTSPKVAMNPFILSINSFVLYAARKALATQMAEFDLRHV